MSTIGSTIRSCVHYYTGIVFVKTTADGNVYDRFEYSVVLI